MDMSRYIETLDLPIFALLILCFIAIKIARGKSSAPNPTRHYCALLAINAALLCLDIVLLAIEETPGKTVKTVLETTMTISYILQGIFAYAQRIYACSVIFPDREPRLRDKIPFIAIIMAIIGLAIANPFTHEIFIYNDRNQFVRQQLSPLIVLLTFSFFGMTFLIFLKGRSRFSDGSFVTLMGIPIVPLIAGGIQVAIPGTRLLWSGMAIAALLVFNLHQNEMILVDHLTGIHNRYSLDLAIKRKIANTRKNRIFAGLLVDLDDFKAINDDFGHLEGDCAIQSAASIIKGSFHEHDFIARFGGDEFLVLLDISWNTDLAAIKKRLVRRVAAWNETSNKPWRLSFSVGCAVYYPEERLSPKEFLAELDTVLYIDKGRPRVSVHA